MSNLEILEMYEKSLSKFIGLFEELETKDLIVTEQDVNDNAFEGQPDPCDDEYKAHFDNREDWYKAKLDLALVQSLIQQIKRKANMEILEDIRKL